jgi:uncharacterized protein (TIGR00661 family)
LAVLFGILSLLILKLISDLGFPTFQVGPCYNTPMNILYTICGDGNGHAFRSSVVIDHLLQSGHTVAIITSGKAYGYLSQRYGSVIQVHGWSLIYRGNRVKKSSTLAKNFAKFKYLPKDLQSVRSLVKRFQPQIVISDFEPSGGLIATMYDLPLISLDNQHIISDTKVPVLPILLFLIGG